MISLRQVKESHIFPRATKHLAMDSLRWGPTHQCFERIVHLLQTIG
jgi:hypothetical protein